MATGRMETKHGDLKVSVVFDEKKKNAQMQSDFFIGDGFQHNIIC